MGVDQFVRDDEARSEIVTASGRSMEQREGTRNLRALIHKLRAEI